MNSILFGTGSSKAVLTTPSPQPAPSSPQVTPIPWGTNSQTRRAKTNCNKDSQQIPKPPGGPGRPRSGGYNLQEQLGWEKDEFEEIKVRVKFD